MATVTIIIRLAMPDEAAARVEVDRLEAELLARFPAPGAVTFNAPYESRLDSTNRREAERNAAVQAAQADMLALAAAVKADPALAAAVEAAKAKAEEAKLAAGKVLTP